MAGAVEHTDCFSAEGEDSPNECPRYDTKQSDGEIPVMLELCGMQSTPYIAFAPDVVAPDRVLSMGQIELNCVLWLNWIVWNRTVYMYKNGFGINDLQWLICHETKPKVKGHYISN